MKESPIWTVNDFVGRRLKRDLYNRLGAVILPAHTVLTRDHIEKIRKHGVVLSIGDVTGSEEDSGTEENRRQKEAEAAHKKSVEAVQRSTERMKEVFLAARSTRRISLLEIKNEIMPSVMTAAGNPNFFKLLSVLQEKDDYVYRHHVGVAVLATLMGKWMQMEQNDLLLLTMAALLHDIGMIQLPDAILYKKERLSERELEEYKKHTIYGYEILKNTVGLSHRIALVALQHHEREDGSGYPFALKQEKIDLFSSIVAVADEFHELTSDRYPYTGLPFYQVIEAMRSNAFGPLSLDITNLFLGNIMDALVGCEVILTDGRRGRVVLINRFDLYHPLVKAGSDFIDLSQHPGLHIASVSF